MFGYIPFAVQRQHFVLPLCAYAFHLGLVFIPLLFFPYIYFISIALFGFVVFTCCVRRGVYSMLSSYQHNESMASIHFIVHSRFFALCVCVCALEYVVLSMNAYTERELRFR